MGTDDLHIGRYIGKLSNMMRRMLEKDADGTGCSGAERHVLGFIMGEDREIFQKDIEEEFLLRPPTATEMVKRLEAKGLITRSPVERDGRLKRIELTEKAEEIGESIRANVRSFERNVTKGISERELRSFCRTAEKMIANLSQHTEI